MRGAFGTMAFTLVKPIEDGLPPPAECSIQRKPEARGQAQLRDGHVGGWNEGREASVRQFLKF